MLITIKKKTGYEDHQCLTGLDEIRDKDFNAGKEIGVTLEELNTLSHYTGSWLDIIGEVKDVD
jgi:hypothetical protein